MHINSIKIVYHILNAEEKYLAKNTTHNKTAGLSNYIWHVIEMTESTILKTKLQKRSSLPKYYLFNSTKTAGLISKHDTSLRWQGLSKIIHSN
jgi:hypothetical protein